MKNSGRKNKKGYTLIELMLVVAISLIILTLTISTFAGFSSLQSLDKDTEVIAGYIQKARSQTINSKDNSEFGIKIASTTITLFEGTSYTAGAASNTVYTLSPKVSLSSNQMKTAGSIVTSFYFQQISGKPTATGTIQYKLTNDPSNTRTITIYGSGLIETQ